MARPHKMSDQSDKSDESDSSDDLAQELADAQRSVSHLITLLADIREASGVGMRPMAFELPEAIRQRLEEGAAWSPERRAAMLAQHPWLAQLASRRPAVAAALHPDNQPEGATTTSVLLTVLRASTTPNKTTRKKR